MEVTKQGGKVLEVLSARPVGIPTITREQAVVRATRFLERNGYSNMAETYFIDQGNTLTINFAPLENDIICYPDLVKVSIALDNGDIVGFDGKNYLMNHQERNLAAPIVTLAKAQTQVTEGLHILTHRLALIPTTGQNEVLCHEFKCQTDGEEHYIVYVNAETGEQEKILLLLEDENGTLVL